MVSGLGRILYGSMTMRTSLCRQNMVGSRSWWRDLDERERIEWIATSIPFTHSPARAEWVAERAAADLDLTREVLADLAEEGILHRVEGDAVYVEPATDVIAKDELGVELAKIEAVLPRKLRDECGDEELLALVSGIRREKVALQGAMELGTTKLFQDEDSEE